MARLKEAVSFLSYISMSYASVIWQIDKYLIHDSFHCLIPCQLENDVYIGPEIFFFMLSMMSMRTLLLIALAAALCISGSNGKQQFMKRDFHARRAEAAKRYYHNSLPQARRTNTANNSITFSNPKVSG